MKPTIRIKWVHEGDPATLQSSLAHSGSKSFMKMQLDLDPIKKVLGVNPGLVSPHVRGAR